MPWPAATYAGLLVAINLACDVMDGCRYLVLAWPPSGWSTKQVFPVLVNGITCLGY